MAGQTTLQRQKQSISQRKVLLLSLDTQVVEEWPKGLERTWFVHNLTTGVLRNVCNSIPEMKYVISTVITFASPYLFLTTRNKNISLA